MSRNAPRLKISRRDDADKIVLQPRHRAAEARPGRSEGLLKYISEERLSNTDERSGEGSVAHLYPGRTLGVVGESGSGRRRRHDADSLTPATKGQVLYNGVDLLRLSDRQMMEYRRKIQIIFQNPYASLNPRFTVGQILTEPMKIHGIGASDQERFSLAVALARRVGLADDSVHKYPHEFSGGQRQRIAIARCLSMKPDVLICANRSRARRVGAGERSDLLLDMQMNSA